MKVSQLLVRTLREPPSNAELPSHIYLLRGGYIKQMAAGLYSILPLGKRVLSKIENIIRQEMIAVNGQEIDLPLVQPADLWKESGRYQAIGSELLRFRDRTQHDMVLAMTHEEAVTDLARGVLSSYKQLPFMVYQFKLKFRDEPRARGGLIRVREFVMKDAYSFHRDEDDLDAYYQNVYEAYVKIFRRVGIVPIIVQSDTGIMGGKQAHEFMLKSDHGEDYLILSQDGCYAANQEIAQFDRCSVKAPWLPLEKVPTPGFKTIEEVRRHLGVDDNQIMKAVYFRIEDDLILVLLRGDLEVSEAKVKNYLKIPWLVTAEDTFIRGFGMIPGYASALGVPENIKLKVLADSSIIEGNNFVAGANEEGFHFLNVNFERDFTTEYSGDFAKAQSGHKTLGQNTMLEAVRGIEIGNIFKLGTKFSQSMEAFYSDETGKQQVPMMGCYGIGVGRLMAAVVENSHDDFGPIWPKEIAPFQVHILNIGREVQVTEHCESLKNQLETLGFEVLFDDRDERPGVKFKDADLWGIPVRIAISAKSLADGMCEWKQRREKSFDKIPLAEVALRLDSFYKNPNM